MQPQRPSAIEAALLYDDYKPFDYAGFARFLQKVFKDQVQVKLGVHEDYSFGVLVVGSSHIMISQNKEPLGRAGFQEALKSEYMNLHYPEADDVVQSHSKNIFVTVGARDIVMTPELEEIVAKTAPDLELPKSPPPSQSQFENHWLVAQIVTHLLCIVNAPRLIHWCQSNRFVRADEWAIAVKNRSGWPFQVHPCLFNSQQTDDQGRTKVGIGLHGSEHFTGHHMVVEETTFDVERVIDEIVFELMAMLHGQSELPQNSSKISFKSGASVRLDLRPADEIHPRPYLSLEILSLADINPSAEMDAPDHASQAAEASEPAQETPEDTPQATAAPNNPAQTNSNPVPFAHQSAQSKALSPDRISQVLESSPGGPKRLIASPVHPNAPDNQDNSESHNQKHNKKSGTAMLGKIGAVVVVVCLVQGARIAKQYLRGGDDTVVEASIDQTTGMNDVTPVETPKPPKFNLPQIRN